MSDALTLTRRRAMAALKPPPVLPLANWIEANIHFPATVSALPGKVRLWSYQRGICDAIDDPEISRITVQKSARRAGRLLQVLEKWFSAKFADQVLSLKNFKQ